MKLEMFYTCAVKPSAATATLAVLDRADRDTRATGVLSFLFVMNWLILLNS